MWTEPERVSPGSWISSVYPQYVYQPDRPDATTVVDLGNPEALRYLKQFVSAAVEKYKLSVWRVDFNTNPAVVWARTGDAHTGPTNKTAPEFRRGMNEAGYVRGLYELWVRGILSFLGCLAASIYPPAFAIQYVSSQCCVSARRATVYTLCLMYHDLLLLPFGVLTMKLCACRILCGTVILA
jgi:hypothetical protein